MIPKVCSYRRSGTHLIMATIYHNFEVGDQSKECVVYGWEWAPDGEKKVVVPWAGLFGTHKPFSKNKYDGNKILYGVRHPLDTLVSWWRMPICPAKKVDVRKLEDWIVKDRILEWVRHVEGYVLEGQCYWIRFEDLLEEGAAYVALLNGVQRNFRLVPKVEKWVHVEEQVSWLPNKPKPATIHPKLIARINKNVPDDLMQLLGYEKKEYYEDYSVLRK